MAHEKLRPQYLFDAEKIEKQKQLTPECFEDGKINFETLRQNLGEWTQNEEDPELEHFGLFWPGKRDARKVAALPPEGTLEPVFGDGLKADGTPDTDGINDSKNIFIEGENLEVLKLLQKSYSNKVKLIYIDPPYNTGNDFVYDDDFTEPLQEYLRRTGQIDEEGKSLTTNKKSDGRFHSKWLSMIYPRLRLARNLLREDGVIFVSIDDNEVTNLKLLLNEIFGEENCLATIANINNPKGRSDDKYFARSHEYILVYQKASANIFGWEPEDNVLVRYNKQDDDGKKYREIDLRKTGDNDRKEDRPNLFYPFFYNETTKEFYPSKSDVTPDGFIKIVPTRKDGSDGNWRWEMATAERNLKTLTPGFMGVRKKWTVFEKDYLTDDLRVKPTTSWTHKDCNSERGTEQFIELGFDKRLFPKPKPIGLIKRILKMIVEDGNEIVLDFFSGSGTFQQSVLEYNHDNRTNLKFISVQLPEPIESDHFARSQGYSKISEITIARIKQAIDKYKSNEGFKSYKLVKSNFKKWQNVKGASIFELESKLALFNENPLNEIYTTGGLLSEILLIEGFTLCSVISEVQMEKNSIRKISNEYCQHSLLVCLDDKISKETISKLSFGEDDIFICLDSAISTEDKLRLSDKGLIKTI